MYIQCDYKPSVELGLKASKSEYVPENNDNYVWRFLNLHEFKRSRATLEKLSGSTKIIFQIS